MYRKIIATIRASLMGGLLFIAPFWLSIFLVSTGYNFIENNLGEIGAQLVRWSVPAHWLSGRFADGHIPGLSLLAVFVLIYLLGVVASWKYGRQALRLFEHIFLAVPVVNLIYSSARKMIDAFGDAGQKHFQKVVFIDWPGDGVKTMGFVTSELAADENTEKRYVVFVPAMPNPTSGFVVVLPVSKVVETSMTTEEALKFGMSLGVLTPSSLPVHRI